MSKGSAPRPLDVDREKFSSNWDLIFKKKPEPEQNKQEDQKDDDKDKQ